MAPLQHPTAGRSSQLTHHDRKEVTRCNRKPGPSRHSPRHDSLGPRNRDCTIGMKKIINVIVGFLNTLVGNTDEARRIDGQRADVGKRRR